MAGGGLMFDKDNNNNINSGNEVNLGVLESILNGMDAYIYVTDPVNDDILFINDKMREHFDFGSRDGVGVKCWAVLQTGMTQRCAFCPMHRLSENPDKTIVWEEHNTVTSRHYRNSDKLIKWPDGRLVHMQHSVDITEMKETAAAQQALMSAISQNFLSDGKVEDQIYSSLEAVGKFMDYARVLLSSYNEQADELYVTHEWLAKGVPPTSPSVITGVKCGDTLFDRIISARNTIVSWDSAEVARHYNAGAIGVKSFMTTPVFIENKLYGVLEFDTFTDNYLWEGGDVHLSEFICGMLIGLLDSRKANASLTKMSTLIESVMQPVVYIDTQENVTYYNAATYKVLGYTEEEFANGGVLLLFGEEVYERVRTEVWPDAFERGFVEDVELPLVSKDGSIRIFSFLGLVINIDGELPQLATIGTDITDLINAKEAAEAVSKAKTEFLARMSHEIRTPMNAIIGMTSIAQESDDMKRKEYCLEKISSASKHLLGVINDILDMSKIEANKFEISKSEFNFEKMLINITNMVDFRMDEKYHNFLVNFDDAISNSVVGDEQRLSQVVVNLLSNAVKFTPERGTITLSVECVEETDDDIKLRFIVSDTGIGISPEQQKKLFSSFEQADGSISRRFGGTGLGLSISKRIIELMGGTIEIESEIDRGTKVIFEITVEKGTVAEEAKISHQINMENLRILAVDDSEATRDYFKHLMSRLALRCDVASGGAEALAMIDAATEQGEPYNFFFVDWMMSGMDGIELSAQLKSRLSTESIIVMISAARWSDIETEAKAAGVDGFIPKPLFPSALVDCINNCLGSANDGERRLAEEQQDADFSNCHLLLVEDVEINREIVAALLEETNIQIDVAENGIEAVDMFTANIDKYDLIFMDIHMPVMDGYEATREIRSVTTNAAKQIPIVAMTANAFKEDVERCLACGMNDHIPKPIDREVMLEKMTHWLKNNK